jgi:DnaJ homolog subfamily C member 7
MAKKKKATKLNGIASAVSPPSPPTEVESPAMIPTPSSTVGASTSGESTPKENVPVVESKPEDKTTEADALKEKGNVAFKAAKYTDAIKLYTEAISKARRCDQSSRLNVSQI